MLLAIQTAHTFIAVWNIGCLLYMNYCHAAGKCTKLLKIAYISIAAEIVAILPFGFVCPIRLLVDRWYSVSTADILIPMHIAVWIMPAGIFLFATSLACAAGRFIIVGPRPRKLG
ncbi:MAG: hypothetical protein ACRETW_14075 [Stenotrophobium sp.]